MRIHILVVYNYMKQTKIEKKLVLDSKWGMNLSVLLWCDLFCPSVVNNISTRNFALISTVMVEKFTNHSFV